MFTRSLLLSGVLVLVTVVTGPTRTFADPTPNPVIEWASIIQHAIHSAAAPRSGGTSQILHTMVTLAVYDAVVAIDGGYRPFAVRIRAPADADVRAAVATAAYLTARPRRARTTASRTRTGTATSSRSPSLDSWTCVRPRGSSPWCTPPCQTRSSRGSRPSTTTPPGDRGRRFRRQTWTTTRGRMPTPRGAPCSTSITPSTRLAMASGRRH